MKSKPASTRKAGRPPLFSGAPLALLIALLVLALPAFAGTPAAHLSYIELTLPVPFDFGIATGVALDAGGNVFVSDWQRMTVFEVLAEGGYTKYQRLSNLSSLPAGVAVDGSGNVFVAGNYPSAVYEILAAGGYTTVNTLGSGFNSPSGVAVDRSGNAFVADRGDSAVYEILAAGGYAKVKKLGSGFSTPVGVAVDKNGNVYVADSATSKVSEILAAGGYATVKTLGIGFKSLSGIALDGGGNVYITGDSTQEIPAGCTAASCVVTLGPNSGNGIAVDGKGDIFLAEQMVVEVLVPEAAVEQKPAPLYLGTVPIGHTGTPASLTFTFDSAGTIAGPVALTQGIAGLDFAVTSASTCKAATYQAGESCKVDVAFTPRSAGLRTGAVLIQDDFGDPIATVPVYGVGSGPQVSFLPGTQSVQSTLDGGYYSPNSVAVDPAQDLFVALLIRQQNTVMQHRRFSGLRKTI